MKAIFPLILSLFVAVAAQGQNYQLQYPTDPYSAAPRAYSTVTQTASALTSYGADKLLSYGSLEARYHYSDFKTDPSLNNSSGIGVALNAPIFKPLYLHFGLDWLQGTDVNIKDFSLTSLSAGAGIYRPIVSRFHIFGELGVHYDVTSGALYNFHPDEFAVYARPGVRFAANDRLELSASLFFASTKNLNDSVLELNAYFALLSVLDLGVGVDIASDVNTYHGSIRLRW